MTPIQKELVSILAKGGPTTVVLAIFCWTLSTQLDTLSTQLDTLSNTLTQAVLTCGR